MKKLFFYLSLAAIACVTFACDAKKKNENTFIVGTNATYPPYESVGEKGECEGFDIDIAKAVADKLGKKLVIQEFEFDALILALKTGKIDAILSGMSITPARQEQMLMIPYQGEATTFLYLAFWNQQPSFSHLKDLGTIAVQVGTFQEDFLKKIEKVAFKSLEGTIEIIMDIQHKKSQAALFEPTIAEAMKSKFPQLQFTKLSLDQKDWALGYGIGIKKGNTELASKIDRAIQELKKEKIVQELENKWIKKQ